MKGAHLHLDCASGCAGDMTLAALIDLGVPVEVVGDALDAVGAGRWRLKTSRVMKRGIAACDVKVDASPDIDLTAKLLPTHTHDHDHDHPHDHAHHHYGAIRKRIDGAAMDADAKRRALDIFDRVARAEAKLHGTTVEEVAFHEVGAIDSIVDIVGTAAALAWLAPSSVSCTAVAMGHGTLKCAHGVLPVPAPAALEILKDARGVMADGGLAQELCTPTGAAILAHAVTSWTAAPTGTPIAIGWGAGDFELADRANVVRATIIDPKDNGEIFRIEANLDDMSPELCAHALDAAFAAGALDAWWTPITMKKGRPALMISALAPAAKKDAVARAILRETTSLGVRFDRVDRLITERETVEVQTELGPITIKVGRLDRDEINAAPEYESCRAAAERAGVPLKRVYAAAIAAWEKARP
ncbi:MAG TPA: nickel pincer cofactor biosynthesis protein LarC [Kofleriaceae bacterium]|nr:nickel pincer cofactor biosynthesis protein LarC [Kofleriaceae bacterium]